MNRRRFFSALGASVAIVVAKPIAMAKPIDVAKSVAMIDYSLYCLEEFLPLDVINAVAFSVHAAAFPEHREHYRTKAMNLMARRAWDRKEQEL